MLPKDFPPKSTVYHWFAKWRDDGTLMAANHHLLMLTRETLGREASPSAGAIDTQSVKTTESGGPRGYDAGKKTKGRKREIIVDTEGHLITAAIHPANVQDRDAAAITLKGLRRRFPWLEKLFADAGYSGDKLRDALVGEAAPELEIVKRPRDAQGFVLSIVLRAGSHLRIAHGAQLAPNVWRLTETPSSSCAHCARSTKRQRTTPSTYGRGPASTAAANCVR